MSEFLEQLKAKYANHEPTPTKMDEILSKYGRPQAVERDGQWLDSGLNRYDPRSYFVQAVMNLPKDAAEAAVSTIEMVKHPIQTAKGVAELGGSLLEKGGRKFEEFYTGEEIPPTPGKEDMANAVGAQIKESFGSPEAALRTVVENPFDALTLGAGPALSMGKVKPITDAANLVKKGAGKAAQRVKMNELGIPRSTLDEGRDLATFANRNDIRASEKSLKGVKEAQEGLNKQLEKMIGDFKENSGTLGLVPKSVVVKELNKLRNSYKGAWNETRAVEVVNGKLKELAGKWADQNMISIDELHKLKTTAYQDAYNRGAKRAAQGGKTPGPKESMAAAGAHGANKALRARMAEYEGVNKQWGQYARLEPYIAQKLDAPKLPNGELWADFKSVVRKMAPGPRTAKALQTIADHQLRDLFSKTPQQVKYILSQVNMNDTALTLFASGQFDEILAEAKK